MPQEYATIEASVRAAIRVLSTVNATKEGIIDFVQGLSVEASGQKHKSFYTTESCDIGLR
jgi:hypothetical protein